MNNNQIKTLYPIVTSIIGLAFILISINGKFELALRDKLMNIGATLTFGGALGTGLTNDEKDNYK